MTRYKLDGLMPPYLMKYATRKGNKSVKTLVPIPVLDAHHENEWLVTIDRKNLTLEWKPFKKHAEVLKEMEKEKAVIVYEKIHCGNVECIEMVQYSKHMALSNFCSWDCKIEDMERGEHERMLRAERAKLRKEKKIKMEKENE